MQNTNSCCAPPNTCTSAEIFTSSVKLISAIQCCFNDDFKPDEITDGDYFDFIIVGGGSAGSVVANRLSEVPEWNVLLLEAGPKPPATGYVPQLSTLLFLTKYDWNYTTFNNNRTSQGLINGVAPWRQGKLLGGSSILNSMLYVKGREKDYESWYDEGNPSWNPENVYYFEKKAESLQNYFLKNKPQISKFYGQNGQQVINRFNSTRKSVNAKILDSWHYLGIKKVIDPNTAQYEGRGLCGRSTVTAANGIRYGTYRSYLLPVRQRRNLKIVTEAFVTRILIDDSKQACGVEVDINNQKFKIYVKKEIILSAGTIRSPQLLMLSGVGPKDHLESKNIHCKLNLHAVGNNLQDHLRIFIPIFGNISNLDSRNERNCAIEQYCCNRTGYLAQNPIEDILAFYSLNTKLKYPQIQNHLVIVFDYIATFINSLGYEKTATESFLEPILSQNKTLYLFFVNLLHPYSRGHIRLNTSNPYDKPIIDANYFGDNRDLTLTAKGILFLTKIVDSPFFKSIKAFVQRIKRPECDKLIFNTLDYWKCYAKNFVSSIFHPVGSCKMGPNSRNAVVDNFLRVHGVKNLRIIDASIMPKIPSGNTNGPTIMIGEMGADMIKKSYGMG